MRISERAWGWIGPLAIALFALVLRAWNVGHPPRLLFDETYYAKDAWALLQFGYVRAYQDGVDDLVANGQLAGVFADRPANIVHPEVGKAMIAAGEWVFGMSAVGWRVTAVLIGALSVLVIARLVRRLTGSTAIGCLAGLLLALDGMHFVMSRLALLDGFLMFWLLCAVAALVADRDWVRDRLTHDGRFRHVRPWQITAGICFGLAAGTKWSALPVLALFGLGAVWWEFRDRRSAERRDPTRIRLAWRPTFTRIAVPAFGSLVGVGFAVYVLTWTGWLVHHELYAETFDLSDNPAVALAQFHQQTWNFHTGEYINGQDHPFASRAWGWLVLDRPVGVDTQSDMLPGLCGAPEDSSCLKVITLLGNPIVWWTGSMAALVALAMWIRTRDPRWSVPVLGVAATWLPWLAVTERPIFSFYAIATLPFLIIATCLVVSYCAESARTRMGRRLVWTGAVALAAAVAIAFWWWHPIWTNGIISYDQWRARMLFPRWY